MSIFACAPTKAILCGEHFVVHGERAISIPCNLKNCVELSKKRGSDTLYIRGKNGALKLSLDGEAVGSSTLQSLAPIYFEVLKLADIKTHPALDMVIHYSDAPKGMGNSASIACAAAKALSKYFRLKLTKNQLFELTQMSEKVSHSNPSGIDAKTVVEGKAQLFRRGTDCSPPKFKQIYIRLPQSCVFLIVDTSMEKIAQAKTSRLVHKFTKYLIGNPSEKEIRLTYRKILRGFLVELRRKKQEPQAIGNLMNENHKLLRDAGVSSKSIEKAIDVLMAQPGVFGCKLTGAGGMGGAVLALVKKSRIPDIAVSLSANGFRSFTI
ncbi:MAG: hypothetical protein QXW70_00430 [Candidatus Anstonellales archaeon]